MANTLLLLLCSLLSLQIAVQECVGLDIGIGIGIGIGGGGSEPPSECPPPPPPPSECPPPPSPPAPPPPSPPAPPPPSPPPPPPPSPPPPPPPSPPPPPPPSGPQPSDFPNILQYRAYIVIQKFRETITSDPLNKTCNWNGYRPCDYNGFYCQSPPNRENTPTIAAVDFNGYQLGAPTISGFIDQLPDLGFFHANTNNFSGTVPDLTKLQFLYELDLSNNRLSGPFPDNLLPLNNSLFLDIRFNNFSGQVPGSIFALPQLDYFFLNNNGLSQRLPPEIGGSTVSYLTLANNGFTGPIPASICKSSENLIEVLFLNNKLSGCLPYEIGLLHKATVFDAGNNRITGPIPLSFGCLKKVEDLNLAGNLLYGRVPDVVCNLASCGRLENLSLSGNYFTSIGPSCWGLVKSGVLDLRKNCVVGLKDQRPAWECARFFWKPKFCPLLTHMPCEDQKDWGADRSETAAKRAGTVVYDAANKRQHNP